jgi:hypothetical protein
MDSCGLREFQQIFREIGIFTESEKKLEEMGIISLLAMEMHQRSDERAEFSLSGQQLLSPEKNVEEIGQFSGPRLNQWKAWTVVRGGIAEDAIQEDERRAGIFKDEANAGGQMAIWITSR